MIKIVPDTNIIISSIFWRGNPYEIIRRGILGEYKLVISPKILDEVVDKLRNKFQFPEENIKELVDIFLTYCHVVEPISHFDVVRDKSDNKVVDCAFDGKADYIVTGDPDLLDLNEFAPLFSEAEELLKEYKKDALYIALALKMSCPFWTYEKRFEKINRIHMLNTKDVRLLL